LTAHLQSVTFDTWKPSGRSSVRSPKPHRLGLAVLLASASLASLAGAVSAPGDLDPSFSEDGRATTNVHGAGNYAGRVAVDAAGRIVVVGRAERGDLDTRLAVVRYTADGSLDSSFGGDGRVVTDVGDGGAVAVAIQLDGKIVVAGGSQSREDAPGRFVVVRYQEDGSLDETFSGDGKVTADFTGGGDGARGVVIQSDGKIVAVGYAGSSRQRFAVARFTRHGRLDPTFSGDGKLMTEFSFLAGATDVAIQLDGRIVVVGMVPEGHFLPAESANFFAARYTTAGRLDRTFSTDGKVSTDFSSREDRAYGLAIQGDGKIVIVGGSKPARGPNDLDFALARYNVDGSLDSSFGDAGRIIHDLEPANARDEQRAHGVVIQTDGKIVAAGHWFSGDGFTLVRYGSDGSLDTTFGGDGVATNDFGALGQGYLTGVALQSDGRIVAAGDVGGLVMRFAVARYLAD
jgi:uncharacterized delta-60 repeat protein